MRFLDCIGRAATRPIAISAVLEVRLEDRLQHDLGGGLDDPAADRGNSERTLASPGFGIITRRTGWGRYFFETSSRASPPTMRLRPGAFASQAVEWPRPAPLQRAARRPTQACLDQRLGSELRQKGMAQRYLAGGIERAACFALRRRSRAPRRAGLQANHTASGRMAARRMAEGERRLPQNTGFRLCPRTRPSPHSSIMPNCAGASNVITKSSKVNSA